MDNIIVADVENLTDEEARQTRYVEGQRIMRITERALNVPTRAIKDGRIFVVDGNTRRFENQDTNLIELTTEAALRFEESVEDAEDEGTKPEDFVFTIEMSDLTMRRAAFVHGRFAAPREARFADSPLWATPIVGLDVDEDGAAIDVKVLRKALRAHLRNAEQSGFTAATGGAFEN